MSIIVSGEHLLCIKKIYMYILYIFIYISSTEYGAIQVSKLKAKGVKSSLDLHRTDTYKNLFQI